MPLTIKKPKWERGTQVYLTAISNATPEGWEVLNEENEDRIYCLYRNGIKTDNYGNASLDIINCPTVTCSGVTEIHRRAIIPIKDIITKAYYDKLKKNKFKDKEASIEEGSIVVVMNNSLERVIYAKVISVESSIFGSQYEIIIQGAPSSCTVRREDISLPKEVFNVRNVTLKASVMHYPKGANAHIISGYLYIGGDDILITERCAINKKII